MNVAITTLAKELEGINLQRLVPDRQQEQTIKNLIKRIKGISGKIGGKSHSVNSTTSSVLLKIAEDKNELLIGELETVKEQLNMLTVRMDAQPHARGEHPDPTVKGQTQIRPNQNTALIQNNSKGIGQVIGPGQALGPERRHLALVPLVLAHRRAGLLAVHGDGPPRVVRPRAEARAPRRGGDGAVAAARGGAAGAGPPAVRAPRGRRRASAGDEARLGRDARRARRRGGRVTCQHGAPPTHSPAAADNYGRFAEGRLGATEKRSESRPGLCCSVISIPLKSP